MSYPNARDCKHGSKRGKCDLCDMEERVAELERENAVLRAQVETLLTWQELAFVAHPNIDMDMSALAKIKEAS